MVDHLVGFVIKRQMIAELDFHQFGVRYVIGHLSAGTDGNGTVVRGVKDEEFGTQIEASTCRTSISRFIRCKAAAADALALMRKNLAHH